MACVHITISATSFHIRLYSQVKHLMNYIQYQMAQISAKFTEKFSLDFNAVSIVFYIYAVLLYRLMVITDKD